MFILLSLFLWTGTMSAQKVTVFDHSTMKPIEMVAIVSENPAVSVITDKNGQADISAYKQSEYIQFAFLGYSKLKITYAEIEKQDFKVMLIQSSITLDNVVISATRWQQPGKDVPQKVTTISAQHVALQNPQTAADLLGSSGEVFIQKSQQGGGSPMIRGFATNRLLYTVDGIRMNTAIFRAGNIQNVISLDPFAIESSEVLFGPGSVIYGSDAIGGVMSFRTLSPQLSTTDKPLIKGNAVARYSSANNERTGHFDVSIGGKKWASVTSFSSFDFDDLRMGSYGPDDYLRTFYVQRIDSVDRVITNDDPKVQRPTGYSQINLMQKLRFKPTEKWDFQYGFHYSETSEYSRYDRHIEQSANGLPRSAVWNYGPQKWMMNNLTFSNSANNVLYNEMSIRLAHQYFEESRIDRNFSGGQRFRLRTNLEQVQAYSVNADFVKSANKHKFFYGVEFIRNEVVSTGSAINITNNEPIPVADRYPNSTWSSYAAYLNYRYQISEPLVLQAGVRFNQFNLESDFTRTQEFFPFDFTSAEINNSATTGSLGLVYQPNSKWRISVNLSSGFRAPNVDDIGKIFDFAGGEVVVPNPNLSAENAYNGEINISKIFGESVKLDLTGFYTYLDNALVRREFQVNEQDSILYDGELSKVYAIQNAAYATVYGFHFGFEIKLPQGFGLSSRFNYQLGIEETDNGDVNRSRHAAPAFGVSRFTYTYDKLQLELNTMYSAEVTNENLNPEEQQKPFLYAKDANGNPWSPSWYTLNFKAMYQISNVLSISAGIENITDQRYRPYSSGITAAGRNYVAALRARF